MELYTLDGLLRRTELVEGFESYIWTERYSDLGEIQIVTPSTTQFRNLLVSGTYLGHSESKRIMSIETLDDSKGADGIKRLTATGREISTILKDRVAATGKNGVEKGTWTATGKPSNVIRALFDYVCRAGTSAAGDALPLMTAGSLYPAGNIPEEATVYIIEKETSSLWDAVKELADVWDLGIRMYRGPDTGKLYFDVYKGNDRTGAQTTLAPVIFSEDLDSLQGVSELTSIATSKNVALVENDYRKITVYSDGASVNTVGFAKRVLYVRANDINYPARTNVLSDDQEKALNKAIALKEAADFRKKAMQSIINKTRFEPGQATVVYAFSSAALTAALITAEERTAIDSAVAASVSFESAEFSVMTEALTQRGMEELAKNRSISAFDGEVTQLSPYKYNQHYDMGDLVEMRNSTGLANQMLVTEQIFTADGSGERAYPTLTIKLFITPGSWLAWENSQVWLDAPGTWSTS